MLHDELLLWLWLRIKRLLGHEVQVRKRRMGVEYVTHGENKTVSTDINRTKKRPHRQICLSLLWANMAHGSLCVRWRFFNTLCMSRAESRILHRSSPCIDSDPTRMYSVCTSTPKDLGNNGVLRLILRHGFTDNAYLFMSYSIAA